jgi:hypothetical protein
MKAAKKVETVTKTVVRETVGAVGIDLGDRWSHWCALSSTGEVIDRGRCLRYPLAGQGFRWRLRTEHTLVGSAEP